MQNNKCMPERHQDGYGGQYIGRKQGKKTTNLLAKEGCQGKCSNLKVDSHLAIAIMARAIRLTNGRLLNCS